MKYLQGDAHDGLLLAAFQVRITRGITSPLLAARGTIWSAVTLSASCLLFALTYQEGEIVRSRCYSRRARSTSSASWRSSPRPGELSISVMPKDAPDEYQGMFATGEATALVIAPALMILLVVTWGRPGWLVFAVIFLGAPILTTPATRWALHPSNPDSATGRGRLTSPHRRFTYDPDVSPDASDATAQPRQAAFIEGLPSASASAQSDTATATETYRRQLAAMCASGGTV